MSDVPYKKKLSQLKEELEQDRMMLLKTNPMPRGVNLNTLDEYINLTDTLLNVKASQKFSLVFGDVINIQRAMDFAVYPNLLPDKLLMENMSGALLRKIGGKRRSIPNYWSYIGYVIIERITQDSALEKSLVANNKTIIDVTVKKVNSSLLGDCTVIIPNSNATMYIGIVRAVVAIFRESKDLSSEDRNLKLTKLLQDLKQKKELSSLANIPVATDVI